MPNSNENNERYRKLAEQDLAYMKGFAERLGGVETEQASTRSDIKSLFNMMEKVSDQLDRMSDRTRPNTVALFGGALGICSLVATIGVLAFAPVYRSMDLLTSSDRDLSTKVDAINRTRFTPDDGRYLKEHHDTELADLESKTSNRIYRNEQLILELIRKTSELQGANKSN